VTCRKIEGRDSSSDVAATHGVGQKSISPTFLSTSFAVFEAFPNFQFLKKERKWRLRCFKNVGKI
jgi:hypothetical protein